MVRDVSCVRSVRKRPGLLAPALVSMFLLVTGCGSDGSVRAGAQRNPTSSPPVTTVPTTPAAVDPTPSPLPATVPPPATVAPPATVPPPAGIPAGSPWPAIAPIAPGHHAVLVMGDSIAGQMNYSLADS